MSGGGSSSGGGARADVPDQDPIAILAQLGSAEDEPFTVVHQHGGRSRVRSLSQAKGKQRYRLAGGEVVARPAARFAVVAERDGGALITCFAGRVEVRAKNQQLSLEPHHALILHPNGEVEQLTSLAASQLGGDRSMRVHELLEAAERALTEHTADASADTISAASTAAGGDAEGPGREAAAAALASAGAASTPEIVLPDASVDSDDEVVETIDEEVEPFPDERSRSGRWVLAALGAAALIALLLLVLLPGGDTDEDDPDAVAGPATSIEATSTSGAPAVATTEAPPSTAASTTAPPTTGAPSTTAAPTTTIAPPSASLQPKSCVQQSDTITYTAGLTNTSEVRATYEVRVAFVDQTGREVGSATATVAAVAPGASKDFSASGRVPADLRNTGASCAVTSLTGRPA